MWVAKIVKEKINKKLKVKCNKNNNSKLTKPYNLYKVFKGDISKCGPCVAPPCFSSCSAGGSCLEQLLL